MSTQINQVNGTIGANPWPALAAAGAGLAAVLTAVGTFADLTGNESGSSHSFGEFAFVLGMIAVGTALVFGLAVRTCTPSNAPARALGLAVPGLLSVVVFWTGLPAVLAAGSLACALVDRRDGHMTKRSATAVALSFVTVALAIVAAIAG